MGSDYWVQPSMIHNSLAPFLVLYVFLCCHGYQIQEFELIVGGCRGGMEGLQRPSGGVGAGIGATGAVRGCRGGSRSYRSRQGL